jgi:hypothetical protein
MMAAQQQQQQQQQQQGMLAAGMMEYMNGQNQFAAAQVRGRKGMGKKKGGGVYIRLVSFSSPHPLQSSMIGDLAPHTTIYTISSLGRIGCGCTVGRGWPWDVRSGIVSKVVTFTRPLTTMVLLLLLFTFPARFLSLFSDY